MRSFYYMYYVTHSVIILIVSLNARLGSSNCRSQRVGVRQELARIAPCVAPWRPSTHHCLKQGLDSQYRPGSLTLRYPRILTFYLMSQCAKSTQRGHHVGIVAAIAGHLRVQLTLGRETLHAWMRHLATASHGQLMQCTRIHVRRDFSSMHGVVHAVGHHVGRVLGKLIHHSENGKLTDTLKTF